MRRDTRWLRKGPLETVATALILAGVLMMLQPFSMLLYTRSFIVTLIGTVWFLIAARFPE